MGILWYVCTAPLWAAPLWSWMNQSPTYSVECSVTEVFPDGGKTPSGSFTVVLTPSGQTGALKGVTWLEGTWHGDPTLSVGIKAVDMGGGKFPLDLEIANRIEILDYGDGIRGKESCLGCSGEARDDFVLHLDKADDFGGHYEFAFHRKGGRWAAAWREWMATAGLR